MHTAPLPYLPYNSKWYRGALFDNQPPAHKFDADGCTLFHVILLYTPAAKNCQPGKVIVAGLYTVVSVNKNMVKVFYQICFVQLIEVIYRVDFFNVLSQIFKVRLISNIGELAVITDVKHFIYIGLVGVKHIANHMQAGAILSNPGVPAATKLQSDTRNQVSSIFSTLLCAMHTINFNSLTAQLAFVGVKGVKLNVPFLAFSQYRQGVLLYISYIVIESVLCTC